MTSIFLIKLKNKTKPKTNTVKRFSLKWFSGNSVSMTSRCKIAAFWKTRQQGPTAPSTGTALLGSYCVLMCWPGQGLLNAHAHVSPCNEKPGYTVHWTQPFKENNLCKTSILSSKVFLEFFSWSICCIYTA